jgi:hypothetical protein
MWQKYLSWYGHENIEEVVTLDQILCPNLVERLNDEDWNHNVQADYRTYFFRNVEYLIKRVSYIPANHQILLLTETPTQPMVPTNGYEIIGYDIVDVFCSTSVITNCGGFASVFGRQDLNQFGIVSDLTNANRIASELRRSYAFDQHCSNCIVWGIQRYVGQVKRNTK